MKIISMGKNSSYRTSRLGTGKVGENTTFKIQTTNQKAELNFIVTSFSREVVYLGNISEWLLFA